MFLQGMINGEWGVIVHLVNSMLEHMPTSQMNLDFEFVSPGFSSGYMKYLPINKEPWKDPL